MEPDSDQRLLADELLRLVLEELELRYVVQPNLIALRALVLGAWEQRRAEADYRTRRLRRKLALVHAAVQRAERPDLAAIERTLDLEFADWPQRLRTGSSRIREADRAMAAPMPDEVFVEFQRLTRDLAGRFHPRLRETADGESAARWQRIETAYAAHSLPQLQAIAAEYEGIVPAALPAKKTLIDRIAEGLQHVAALKAAEPFTLERDLASPVWVNAQRESLEGETALLELEARGLDLRLAQLTASTQLPRFGPN